MTPPLTRAGLCRRLGLGLITVRLRDNHLEVHCDPGATNAATKPVPSGISKTPVEQKSPAQWAYERIILYLKNFEGNLDNDHEVAICFTGGDADVLRIEGMGYFDPDIVTFYGSDVTGAKA